MAVSSEPHDTPAGSQPRHPIAVVAERTGLSVDVLRVWERRYGAVVPTRGPGGQRLYSDADVERLRLLEAAVQGGRRVGAVARLTTPELAVLVHDDRAAALRRGDAARAMADRAPAGGEADAAGAARTGAADVVRRAMAHVRAFDPRALDALLRRTLALGGAAALLDGVVAPLLRRIGEDWHARRLGIAEEHAASAVIEALVLELMRTVATPDAGPTVLVATLAGGRHVIAAAMAGAAAAAEGWNVLFLGGPLPAADIAAAAASGDARAVAVSMLFAEDPARLVEELTLVRERLPAHVLVVAGGGAVAPLAAELERRGIVVGETLDALRLALRRTAATPRLAAG